MFKKVMALMLVLAMVFSFAACGSKEEDNTTTDNAATNVNATDANTTEANGEDVTEEDKTDVKSTEDNEETDASSEETKADGKTTTKKSDSKTTTKKSDSTTTTKKTDSKTTTKKTENKTTTKKSMVVPSSVEAIVKAYREAANRTKAQKNMKIDKTCEVDIVIDSIAGMEWLAKLANPIAAKYMKQASGAVEKEVFVNGNPTLKTERNEKGKYVNDKSTFIPLYGKSEMCTLDYKNVKSATATKKSDSTYEVVIKLKDDKCSINGTPKITASGMDHFNPNLYDLGDFRFASGTVSYTNCIIVATVNADGYLDYVKHEMSLKTTDTILAYKSAETKNPSALHGEYITTFKFY